MEQEVTIATTTQKSFASVNHIDTTLGITVRDHLDVDTIARGIKDHSQTTALVVLYHYAKKIGKKLEIRDGKVSGHKSHTSGVEVDYALPGGDFNSEAMIDFTADMLKLRVKLDSDFPIFRIGTYVDYTWHMREITTKAQFIAAYSGKKAAASNHLGCCYNWSRGSRKYKQAKRPTLVKSFWLRDSSYPRETDSDSKHFRSLKKHCTDAAEEPAREQIRQSKIANMPGLSERGKTRKLRSLKKDEIKSCRSNVTRKATRDAWEARLKSSGLGFGYLDDAKILELTTTVLESLKKLDENPPVRRRKKRKSKRKKKTASLGRVGPLNSYGDRPEGLISIGSGSRGSVGASVGPLNEKV